MKRRSLLFFVLLVLLLIPGWAAAAGSAKEEPVNLMIDGQAVKPDVPPLIQNGRTLVPIRVIAEGLGADVKWDEAARTATIKRGVHNLVLTLDSTAAKVNGKQVKLDTPPVVRQQRMLLPIRFVAESLGVTVGWNASTRTVIANETPAVLINGKSPSKSLDFYRMGDSLYVSAQAVAEQVGWKDFDWKHPAEAITIDDQQVVPLDRLEEELGGRMTWDKRDNRVEIKRLSRFTGVAAEGDSVWIDTTLPVTPETFVLEGPHRIVLDLPQTELDDDLVAKLGSQKADEVEETDGQNQPDQTEEANQMSPSDKPEDDTLIANIRYSQYSSSPKTVRVVIELNQKSQYNLEYTNDGIAVKLAPAATAPGKTGFLIVVDAGHGGHDNGASGTAGNVEKDFTLAVSKKLAAELKQYPEFQVEMTRTTDVYLTLAERVEFANSRNADLFISIHANSFTKPTAGGTETFYYNANSEALARIVHRHLQGATKFADRGVKQTAFYVIKNTKMPAVLTETGFLSNPTENAQLTSPAFQDKVAKALAAAIREYYLTYR
ncbi:N-acetylmuramoyl-L-alanine amidase family protein [Brevibacillus sp. NL20B1]|jgi:N-acetylmuramoyl-L-alanine amidase|uniref:N-acetylmuramoyl-L-alanine amidase family protein n=1 Tax=Brevibacillus sp. NL20B1 TaxID=2829799 RepID=UPI001B8F3ED8|nr:N-acetylmuramoyl-L-alanine amidase family protein [Brevibacillus sp. NL20B1]MBR8661697.1 N-acetylmuramoyl-L-alanine amidase [Brevibacillus sp. NL20B1]